MSQPSLSQPGNSSHRRILITVIILRSNNNTTNNMRTLVSLENTRIITRNHCSQLACHEGALSTCVFNLSWANMGHQWLVLTTDDHIWFLEIILVIMIPVPCGSRPLGRGPAELPTAAPAAAWPRPRPPGYYITDEYLK